MLPRPIWLFSRLIGSAQAGTSAERARTISSSPVSLRLLREPLAPQPPTAPEGAEKAELVARFLSLDNASRRERSLARLRDTMRSFQRFSLDTGSTEVQVALLTEKIKLLAEHLSEHRKDHSSRRGLQAMLARRRSLLQYLRRTQFDTYAALIGRLGLKDAPYAPQDRLSMRYKPAVVGRTAGAAGAARRA